MARGAAIAAALCVVWVASCGDDGEPADASQDAGEPDVSVPPPPPPMLSPVAPPAPVIAPEPTTLAPCRAGWREVDLDGIVVCDPWPATGYDASCADGEAHFPGEPGCVPIGDPCPTGDWPEGLPEGTPVYHARPGAEGGDGTRLRPYGSIAEALSHAPSDSIVALAKGTYDELVRLGRVTLWGACARDVIITTMESSTSVGVITTRTAGASVRNVQVVPRYARPGVMVGPGRAAIALDGVLVRDAAMGGVWAFGEASVTGRTVVVHSTRRGEAMVGAGALATEGGHVELTRVVVTDSEGVGVETADLGADSVLHLEDAVIRRTIVGTSRPEWGIGANLDNGAEMTLGGVVLLENEGLGLWASSGSVSAEDLVLQGNGTASGIAGGALFAEATHASIRRVLARGNVGAAVAASGEGTVGEIDHLVVRDPRPWSELLGGAYALVATVHASLVVSHMDALDTSGFGAVSTDLGAIDLRDAVIRNTRAAELSRGGIGLATQDQGEIHVERVQVIESRAVGVLSDNGRLSGTDLDIRRVEPGLEDVTFGHALQLQLGASATLARLAIEESGHAGIYVLESRLDLSDVTVANTDSDATTGMFGWGIIVEGATDPESTATSDVIVERVRVTASREVGIGAVGYNVVATMRDVEVIGTQSARCAEDTCVGQGAGIGVAVALAASLTIERFRVDDSAVAGAGLDGDRASLLLRDGEISRAAVGLLSHPDADLRGVLDGVLFRDVVSEREPWAMGLPRRPDGILDDDP